MKGTRPFSDQEADAIFEAIGGHYAGRDKAIFSLGRYSGERISAILRLKVADVAQQGKLTDSVTYRRANRKGKTESRTVALHPKAKRALADWLDQLAKVEKLTPDSWCFPSRKGNRPLGRVQFHRILKEAVARNKITGPIATHSLRKTFANGVYNRLGKDLFRLQKALGHKNINSTVQYLSFREADIEKAIRGLK
jgi:integrase